MLLLLNNTLLPGWAAAREHCEQAPRLHKIQRSPEESDLGPRARNDIVVPTPSRSATAGIPTFLSLAAGPAPLSFENEGTSMHSPTQSRLEMSWRCRAKRHPPVRPEDWPGT